MYEVFVEQCVIRPQFSYLKRAYETYKLDNGQPCKAGYSNQCAVRMSIALARAGFGLESFQPRTRVHDGIKCHTDGIRHVLGARELADFLCKTLFQPTVFAPVGKATGCGSAYENISKKTGIVYFNHCFTRAGEQHKHGDHIDLFDGEKYYNQIIHPRAGGNESKVGSMFSAADLVWFWQLA